MTDRAGWYVEFAQLNLMSLGDDERKKLIIDARRYLFNSDEEMEIRQDWSNESTLKSANDEWSTIIDCQISVREALDQLMRSGLNERIVIGHRELYISKGKYDYGLDDRWVADNPAGHARINVLTAFLELPTTCLQYCPACGRLFFNPTARLKKYCSANCAWKFHAKKRREADPEGYREKQREIMRKRSVSKKLAADKEIKN